MVKFVAVQGLLLRRYISRRQNSGASAAGYSSVTWHNRKRLVVDKDIESMMSLYKDVSGPPCRWRRCSHSVYRPLRSPASPRQIGAAVLFNWSMYGQ